MFEGMFEGFKELLNTLGKEKAMKFRQQANYRRRFDAFGEAVRAYKELREKNINSTDGLEELMLEAYRFMTFLRKEGNALISQTNGSIRDVNVALLEVMEVLDEPLEYCVPIYREADALETLSLSIYKKLKDKGEIKYCKHCKKFLDAPCKKHKEPTSVEDLHFCSGCRGYLTSPCNVHIQRTL